MATLGPRYGHTASDWLAFVCSAARSSLAAVHHGLQQTSLHDADAKYGRNRMDQNTKRDKN